MPVVRWFQDDASAIADVQNRQLADAYRSTLDPGKRFVEMLQAYRDAYPHMEPGVIISLANAGVMPNSPEAMAAAGADLERQRSKNLFDQIGDVVGTVAKPIGAVASLAARGADTVLGGIDESLTPAAKGAVRTAFVVLETGGQELTHILRTGAHWALTPNDGKGLGQTWNEGGTSSGVLALAELLDGDDEKVDLGSGFLPSSESTIAKEQKRQAGQLELTINGHTFGGQDNPNGAITLGRILGANVAEPGTDAFNIVSGLTDAGIAWYGDPAAWAGAVAKGARVGARAGRAAQAGWDAARGGEGLVTAAKVAATEARTAPVFAEVIDRSFQGRGVAKAKSWLNDLTGRLPAEAGDRATVLPHVVEEFFTKGGRRVIQKMSETSSLAELHHATGGKVPIKILRDIADMNDPVAIQDYLRPLIGTQLREAPQFLGYKVRRSNAPVRRLSGDMPSQFLDPDDLDQSVTQMDNWLRNMKASPELRDRSIETIGRLQGREGMVDALNQIMGDAAEELAVKIRPRDFEVTRLPDESDEAFEARSAELWTAKVGGRTKELTRLFNRDVDRTKAYLIDEIVENARVGGVTVADESIKTSSPYIWLEHLNNVVPLPDAREVRRATSRLNRLVDNPFFEGTTDTLEWLSSGWKVMALARPAYTVRVIGEEQVRMAASGLDSLFAHPMSFISALVGRPSKAIEALGGKALRQTDVAGARFYDDVDDVLEPATAELQAALSNAASNHADRKVFAKEHSLFRRGEDGYDRARLNALGEIRQDPVMREVASSRGNLDETMQWFWSGKGRRIRERLVAAGHDDLSTLEGADTYVETLWRNIQDRTASDPTLLDAVATGRFNGRRIGTFSHGISGAPISGRWKFDDEFSSYVAGVAGPEVVKGAKVIGDVRQRTDALNNAVNSMFGFLMTKPTNYLSRSSAYRQFHWQRVEEMMPFMDDATRAVVLRNAESAVDAKQFRRMADAKSNGANSVNNVDDVDDLAKLHALKSTKELLYDLSAKSQFFDTFRLLFPFGEAWKEVVTRWAKIGVENPNAIRKGQMLINGARGNGWFHKDANDEEVWNVPLSGQISKALFGVEVPMTGRVAGLSMMTEVLPGVGPVMQIPAAALLPETPDYNFARKVLFPFGEQDYSEGLLETMAPGFVKRLAQATGGGDQRLFNNAVSDSMTYLMSTGKYGRSVPEQQALFKDATAMARKVFLMRALGSAFLPTAPLPEYQIQDKNDDLLALRVVTEDYRNMQKDPGEHPDAVGFENANQAFLQKYGQDTFLALQGATMSIVPRLPVSKASFEWRQRNPNLVKEYDLTWGLFSDTGDEEDFDYTEYLRQINSGERVALTPEQRYSLAQAKVGRSLYESARRQIEERFAGTNIPASARSQLTAYREVLKLQYPGFGEMVTGVDQKADPAKVMRQLTQAVEDPRLASLPQAEGTRKYLAARAQVLAHARSLGFSGLSSQAMTEGREALARYADVLMGRHPGFAQVFDNVFAKELD